MSFFFPKNFNFENKAWMILQLRYHQYLFAFNKTLFYRIFHDSMVHNNSSKIYCQDKSNNKIKTVQFVLQSLASQIVCFASL